MTTQIPEMQAGMDYLGVWVRFGELVESDIIKLVGCSDEGVNGYTQYMDIDILHSATSVNFLQEAIIQVVKLAHNRKFNDDVILAGAPLKGTDWGSPQSVNTTLYYIRMRPWIRLINQPSIVRLDCSGSELQADFQTMQIINQIQTNPLKDLAISIKDTSLVGHVFAAARWASSPSQRADCTSDIDWDSEPECILSNNKIFTTYEITGGNLVFAFMLDDNNIHQLIGPTTQLNNSATLLNDNQILGAFVSDIANLVYSYEVLPGLVEFTSPDMAIRKSFSLENDSIYIQAYQPKSHLTYQIPFLIDPWLMYQKNWVNMYSVYEHDNKVIVSVDGAPPVKVVSRSKLNVSSFLTSWDTMSLPEDPNYNYTRGYFLPFPLTLVELSDSEFFIVEIQIMP
jgi:hypothetical protein